MDLRLAGRTIVVTAAAGGIGSAIVSLLAAEGAIVVAADRTRPSANGPASEGGGGRIISLTVDLLDPAASDAIVAEALDSTAQLDAVIAVLGGPPPTDRTFLERDDDSWQAAFELNLLSAVRLARAAIPTLVGKTGTSLVFVGSDLARQPDPQFLEYAAMKSALLSLSKSLSVEYGPTVRSNVLSPGPTRTPGIEREFSERIGPSLALTGEQALERYVREVRRMPSGRLAAPEEIARAAAFLVSSASAPMTGAELVIDGGTRKAS